MPPRRRSKSINGIQSRRLWESEERSRCSKFDQLAQASTTNAESKWGILATAHGTLIIFELTSARIKQEEKSCFWQHFAEKTSELDARYTLSTLLCEYIIDIFCFLMNRYSILFSALYRTFYTPRSMNSFWKVLKQIILAAVLFSMSSSFLPLSFILGQFHWYPFTHDYSLMRISTFTFTRFPSLKVSALLFLSFGNIHLCSLPYASIFDVFWFDQSISAFFSI